MMKRALASPANSVTDFFVQLVQATAAQPADYRSLPTIKKLTGHHYGIKRFALLPNGHLVSTSYDKAVRIWDLTQERCIQSVAIEDMTALAVLADGTLAVSIRSRAAKALPQQQLRGKAALKVLEESRYLSLPHTIQLYNPETGQQLCSFDATRMCHMIAHGDRLITSSKLGAEDNVIRVWNTTSGECIREFKGHQDPINCLLSISENLIASGSGHPRPEAISGKEKLGDNTIRIWDISTGNCVQTLTGHTYGVIALALLSDGRLASSSYDRTLCIWDRYTGACLFQLTNENARYAYSSTLVGLPANLLACRYHNKWALLDLAEPCFIASFLDDYQDVSTLMPLSGNRLACGGGKPSSHPLVGSFDDLFGNSSGKDNNAIRLLEFPTKPLPLQTLIHLHQESVKTLQQQHADEHEKWQQTFAGLTQEVTSLRTENRQLKIQLQCTKIAGTPNELQKLVVAQHTIKAFLARQQLALLRKEKLKEVESKLLSAISDLRQEGKREHARQLHEQVDALLDKNRLGEALRVIEQANKQRLEETKLTLTNAPASV